MDFRFFSKMFHKSCSLTLFIVRKNSNISQSILDVQTWMHVFVLRNAINLLKDNLKQLCKLEENKVAKTNGKSSLHLPTIQQKYCTRLVFFCTKISKTKRTKGCFCISFGKFYFYPIPLYRTIMQSIKR